MDLATYNDWEAVIGLEIHVQLNTESKLFSHAPNRFGDEPNTNITDVCTGQPGTLPRLNVKAIKKAVEFGCAIKGSLSLKSRFDRKSYFYPDSPRNYQITQFEYPLIIGGYVLADVEGTPMQFAIDRAHIEDDSGMLRHFTSFTGIDYNRAGAPLIEIVSKPCIHSAKEAVAYASVIKSIMSYIDASDCNMEEGSLRVDVNISVRRKKESHLRPKIEIKNMNSFSNMEIAINKEIKRQIDLYLSFPAQPYKEVIFPGTYRFDPESEEIVLMRRKEEAEDYRYFPEPDLPPLILSQQFIDQTRASLPELPYDKYIRYTQKLELSKEAADTLIQDKELSVYFESASQSCPYARTLCNWLIVEFVGRCKELNSSIYQTQIPPEHLAALVNMIEDGSITGKIAKSIADDMIQDPKKHPKLIVGENPDYLPLLDPSIIDSFIDAVIEQHPQSIEDLRAGKQRAFGFLVGQVMKLSKGAASPAVVNERLSKKINEL